MKHALFVAFHYPPEASSSGVLRTLKFTRYLEEFGWRVSVITLNRSAYATVDAGLEAQIPSSVKVVRTPYLNTKKHLSVKGRYPAILAVPDRWVGWMPWAVAAGHRVIKADRPDVIYSTSPHATAHLIAHRLSTRNDIPWVADFRDPWYEDPPEPGTPPIVQWFAPRLERKVAQNARVIVTSTEQLRDTLRQRYPARAPENTLAILNGYDEADFAGLAATETARRDHLLIVHAGNINPQFRDPRPLLESIARLGRQGKLDTKRIRLRFLGGGEYSTSAELNEALRQTGLADNADFPGRMPYEEALAEQLQADALLLLQASPDTAGLVPAKLYEYLRVGKPVLALVNKGATEEVLTRVGGGWAVDPVESAALDAAVERLWTLWEARRLAEIAADEEQLKLFDRRHLTKALAGIFDRVAGGVHPGAVGRGRSVE